MKEQQVMSDRDVAPGHALAEGTSLQGRVDDFRWLLASFARHTASVRQAVCVSGDGRLMAVAPTTDQELARRLATAVAHLRVASENTVALLETGGFHQVVVELFDGYLLANTLPHGATLGVLTTGPVDLGLLGYATTLFVQRVSPTLDADLVAALGS